MRQIVIPIQIMFVHASSRVKLKETSILSEIVYLSLDLKRNLKYLIHPVLN